MAHRPCLMEDIYTLQRDAKVIARSSPCATKVREFRPMCVTKSLICISLLKRLGPVSDWRSPTESCSCTTVRWNLIRWKAKAPLSILGSQSRKAPWPQKPSGYHQGTRLKPHEVSAQTRCSLSMLCSPSALRLQAHKETTTSPAPGAGPNSNASSGNASNYNRPADDCG